jgi:hypothetical protein
MAAIIAGCITGSITMYFIVDQSRFKVLSQTDAKSGLRIEYSVSNHYLRHTLQLLIKLPYPDRLEDWVYEPKPPPAAVQWLNRYVLRRPPPPTTPRLFGADTITAIHWREGLPEFQMKPDDRDGSPVFDSQQASGEAIVQDHKLIHGCPVTWCSIDWGNIGSTKTHHYQYYVVAKPKRQSMMCILVGEADGATAMTDVRAEMLAIRDSIRVVKGR